MALNISRDSEKKGPGFIDRSTISFWQSAPIAEGGNLLV